MALFGSSGKRRPGPGSTQDGQFAADATGSHPDVVAVNERNFESEVLRSELPVFIEFTAEWCGPCKTIAPEVHAFAREVRGKAKVVAVDVDECPQIAQQLRVQSIPTFMVFAEGRIQEGVAGVIRKQKMRAMVEPFLPRAQGALKPIELAELLKERSVVPIDTRDAGAFGRTHLPGAKNLPIEEIEQRLAELHMVQGVPVLYCRSGDKTKELAEKLAGQGAPVAFLEGGLLAWEADNLPVEK